MNPVRVKLLREGSRYGMIMMLESGSQNMLYNLRKRLYEKLMYNDINKEDKPVMVNFEYSRAADDIESFLVYDIGEDDVPEDDEIQSIEFDLFIWNMFNFSVECTLHGDKGDYFIGDFRESMHSASEWLEQIPEDVLAEIKEIFKEED